MKQSLYVVTFMLKLVLAFSLVACEENEGGQALTATLTLRGSDTAQGIQAAAVDAASLRLQVYEAWVSVNGDCSNPVQVFSRDDLGYQEFSGQTNIGQGEIAVGTYNCVILIMSDNILFTPAANDGAQCVSGTEYTADVCNSDNPAALEFPDQSSAVCSDGDDRVPLYLSTSSTSTSSSGSHNPFEPPTGSADADSGFRLDAPLVVSGNTDNYFIVDVSNKIDGSGSSCDMNPPEFSFQ